MGSAAGSAFTNLDQQNDRMATIQAKYDIKLAFNTYLQFTKSIYPDINTYLTSLEKPEYRGIKHSVLEKYRVGVGKEKFRNESEQLSWFDVVYFPLYALKSKKTLAREKSHPQEVTEEQKIMNTTEFELVKMKVRGVGAENKSKQKFLPSGSDIKGLFGMTTVGENDKAICITEGEFDAMAVYQETGIPSVSLPNGANHLPTQFLPFFDRFDRIYLWMDADEAGRNSSEKFAQKLGSKRVIIIDSKMNNQEKGPKDANDALRAGVNFQELFEQCGKSLGDKNLLSFADIKDKVLSRILNFDELSGIPSKQFTFFNKSLKGFRVGELSLITGATGSGKTTFLS